MSLCGSISYFRYTGSYFNGLYLNIFIVNIRMDIKQICINTRNWVDSAQDRDYWRALVNAGSISHGVS